VSAPVSPDDPGRPPAGTPATASIGREMAKGAAWMVLMRLAIRGIGLISTVVLARLLVPDDFGLVALSTSIVFADETLGYFSFDVALIRDSKAGRAEYDTAWTLSVIRGWLTAFFVAALAVPMGEVFKEPRLDQVLYVLAALSVVEGYQNIGIVDLRKDLKFRREFHFMLSQRIVSFVVTLVLAVNLRDYWALLAGIAAGRITGTIASYFMSAYRPRHCLSEWRPLLSFSKWLLVNNILSMLQRADAYIIGRYFGAHDLGVYNVSAEIASLPSTELVAPIQRAIYPGFAKLAENTQQLKDSYIHGLAILMMVAIPASTGIAVLADPIVRALLGPNWTDAVPLLQILSLNGLIRLGSGNASSVFLAIGRPRTITLQASLNLAILIPLLIIGISLDGLSGAAWALVGASTANLVVSYTVIAKNLHISVIELAKAVWRSWFAAAIMAVGVLWGISQSAWLAEHPLAQLAAGIPLGAVIYVVALLLLWMACGRPRSAERMTLDAIHQLRGRASGRKAGTVQV
jgi:O-antigen/teichoic acid export membrane protein